MTIDLDKMAEIYLSFIYGGAELYLSLSSNLIYSTMA